MQQTKSRRAGRRNKLLCGMLAALFLLPSLASVAVAQEELAYYDHETEHAQVHFSDMEYTGYDMGAFQEMITKLRELTDSPRQSEALLAQYDRLVREMEVLETQYALASIYYYQNGTDLYWQREYMQAEENCQVAMDAFFFAVADILRSGYSRALVRHIGNEKAENFRGYEPLTEECFVLSQRERELVQDYYSLLEEGFQTRQQANERLGEKYLQMREVRMQIAECYDEAPNYAEYASWAQYARTYDIERMKELFSHIKSEIAPVYRQMGAEYQEQDELLVDRYRIAGSQEQIALVGEYVGRISWEMQQAWEYLLGYGLYDIEPSTQKLNVGFTISVPQYKSAFLFNRSYGGVGDIDTLTHEFGHFNYIYWDKTPSVYAYPNFDLMEIHSQGLEMLYTVYYSEMYAADMAEAKYYDQVYSILGAIVKYACLAEFEVAVYTTEGALEITDLNRIYREISRQYGLEGYPGETDDQDLYWMNYDHLFSAPMYSISYAVSGLAALDIWRSSLENWDAAVDSYLTLSSMGTSETFDDTLRLSGMSDVFSRGFARELGLGIVEEFGLQTPPELQAPLEEGQTAATAFEDFRWTGAMTAGVAVFTAAMFVIVW